MNYFEYTPKNAPRPESIVITLRLQAFENILGICLPLLEFRDVMSSPHARSRVFHAGRCLWRRILALGQLFIRNEIQSPKLRARRRHQLHVIVKKGKVNQAQTIVMSLIFWRSVDAMDCRLNIALREVSGGKKRRKEKEAKDKTLRQRTLVMCDMSSPALMVTPPGTGFTHFHWPSLVSICRAATFCPQSIVRLDWSLCPLMPNWREAS
jgi:hypothetical protein